MDDASNNIITFKNAAFGYDGRTVIRDINFTVKRGDYLCIVGENGSGKSTLLKGVLRLINPSRGEAVFSDDAKTTGTGYLAQTEAAKKDFPAGVSEIVISGFAGSTGLRPFYSRAEKESALKNMKLLGVYDLKDRCFRELSGGQQRRVLIARSLCASTSVLALDEPASGLDPVAAASLCELLAQINKEAGITVLSVTHDIQAALRFASHILHIKNGRCFFGTVSEYKQSEFAKTFAGKEGGEIV